MIVEKTRIDRTKDFNGDPLPELWGHEILTVKKLKSILEEYPDNTIIYMEAVNSGNKNDTQWSQRAVGTYSCKEAYESKKALMIVGSVR